jgi:putative hydrolase of the HAD superfamily
MKAPRAVLFDLDDTILSTDATADASWRETCERVQQALPGVDAETLFQELLKQRAWYWSDASRHTRGRLRLPMAREEIAALALAKLGVRAPELPRLMASTYTALAAEKITPFPRAIETLEWLRGRGVRLGLITNGASEVQRWKINRFALAKHFDVIVVEEEFGIGKPDPSVFQYALREVGVHPRDAWMVGDRLDWDIIPSQALGIAGVWNDYRKAGLPPDAGVVPSRIVHSIAELIS